MNNLDKIFHLKENHTDVKTEVIAGVTTFMTMAYILAVNPSIMSAAGMDSGAIFACVLLSSSGERSQQLSARMVIQGPPNDSISQNLVSLLL